MKKIVTTIILSCMGYLAFAQQSFKPIYFTFVIDTYPQNKLKATTNGYEKSDEIGRGESRSIATGTIEINAKDSVININNSKPVQFKVLGLEPEQTSIHDDQTTVKKVTFTVVNKVNNKLCSITILRQTKPGSKNAMNVLLKYDDNTFTTYICDYLKQLN